MKKFSKMVLPLALAMTLVGCVSVDPGNVGVVTDSVTGEIQKQPIKAGTHWLGFNKNVYEFPSGVVNNINLDGLKVNTKEGQEITLDVRVQYQTKLDEHSDKASVLFQKYRKGFEGANGLVETRWIPVIQQAVGYAVSQYGVIDIYQSRGAKAGTLVKQILQDGLTTKDITLDGIGDDFVAVQMVAISDIGLPEAMRNAVARKAQIEQETLSAQQQLAKTRMESQRQLIEAKTEADVKLLKATGEAKARAAIGVSANQYVELEKAKIMADALKNAPNLVVMPPNAIIDARSLAMTKAAGNQ